MRGYRCSSGKVGHQVELTPEDLVKLIHCKEESITVKRNK